MPAERPIDRWKPAPEPPKQNPFVVEKKESRLKLDMAGTSESKAGRPNEDHFLFDAARGLLCVADGMGGTRNSGNASKAVIEGLTADAVKALKNARMEEILNNPPDKPLEGYTRILIEKALKYFLISDVSRRVRQMGDGGDTTASLAKLWTDEAGKKQLTVANVGDSRIYRMRHGRLERLTRDQSLLEELLKEGLQDADGKDIVDDRDVTRKFTRDFVAERSKKSGNFKSLLHFMDGEKMAMASVEDIRHFLTNGMRDINLPQVQTFDTEPGDMVIAVSDGVSDNLTDDEIGETLAQAGDAESASRLLRIRASMRSKDNTHPRNKPDDITAVVMKVG